MKSISLDLPRRAAPPWLGAIGAFALLALGLAGCQPAATTKPAKVPRVIVTMPIVDTVMDYQDFTGRLEAVKMIEIKARVSGEVKEAGFKEGDRVKEGHPLFEIDPSTYAADLNQAEANLKVAEAERNLQEKNAVRGKDLYESTPKAMSREEYETVVAAHLKSAAAVGAVKAARDRSQLYLDYTHVKAPIDGRVSRRFVDPGNLIIADTTVLTTIVSEDKMYAYFDVDERTYLDLLASVKPGQKSWYEGLKLPVMMRLANENEFEKIGVVDFVDNRVAATTGTVRMRGVFQNDNGKLKAGLFVRIRLPIGLAYEAIMIPDEAIQSDQERKYVWVVNSKDEVKYRSVKLGLSANALRVIESADKDKEGSEGDAMDDRVIVMRVIKKAEKGKEGKEGLTLEDRVIVNGMQRAKDGIPVEVGVQPSPAPPHMPLVRLLKESLVRGKPN